MADTPLRESVAPFRESVRAFTEAAAFVRRYGDDRAYWESLRALQALPFASTFHPFAVTAQWVIEQATSAERSRVSRAGQGVLSQMQARSGPRQRMALVNRTPASAPVTPQPSGSSSDRTTDTLASLPETKAKGTDAGPSTESNSWSVLVQVSRLLEELQPAGMVGTMIGRAIGGTASPDEDAARRTRSSAFTQLGRHMSEAAAAQMSRIHRPSADPASRVGSRGNPPATASGQESPLSLLGQAVATLWQMEKPVPTSLHRQSDETARQPRPAPRVPSMLVPSAIVDAMSTTAAERGAAPGEQDRGPSNSAPPQARHDDEPVADRVNRALIEQAWLRGVDLA